MVYDRQITVTVGASRRATVWQAQTLLVSELYDRLQTPVRGTETQAAYLKMPKGKQDDLKDVGGYVAGALSGTRRKAGCVIGRDVLTLDLDNIPKQGTDDVLQRIDRLGAGYCVYSTRKHRPAAPRLRVLLPLDRPVSADEYVPIARKIAAQIGMELADPSTFEASRLMYWPSVCADGEYVYITADKPLLRADDILARYADWRDVSSWPTVPGAAVMPKLAAKQGDPEAKPGVVGAFCRTYSVPDAIDKFLPGVYTPAGDSRLTYAAGSTTGGAVVYDNGKFLYSHHATDPCGGRLVNAFDLVRLHRFGDQDDAAAADTPTVKLPSYTAMCALAAGDDAVAARQSRERYEEAVKEFEGLEASPAQTPDGTAWLAKLDRNRQTGLPKPTIDNCWLILENDPQLKGKFALNRFAGRGEILDALPWDKRSTRRWWEDNDNAGLYWYMERFHKITGCGKIDGALSLHANRHAFNDVQTYIDGLNWDGVPRLDTLLVDYLGAEDSAYTRAVTRKAFTAAVTRAMQPGAKFDCMLILAGPQGLGKSTLLDKMSRGWFNDSIRTFEGKEASELLQGVWLVEIQELDAFRRSDVACIKQFLSLRVDRFRAAYGRHVKELPRCCVFFGTTNTAEFLQDRTGNRRFWPVDVGVHPAVKSVWDTLPGEVDQIWAEAKLRWQAGEALFLTGDLEQAARDRQEAHREVSAKEGVILDFLAKPVPDDWLKWPLDKRRLFWAGACVDGDLHLVPRDRVCALEIWCEAFDGRARDLRNSEAAEINSILAHADGWVAASSARFGPYGKQRGYIRKGLAL